MKTLLGLPKFFLLLPFRLLSLYFQMVWLCVKAMFFFMVLLFLGVLGFAAVSSITSAFADASEEWLCKTQSSMSLGASVIACGVATSSDENTARAKAFDAAKAEFDRVCLPSKNCNGHDVTVVPQRTNCEESNDVFKCYRAVLFEIGDLAKPIEIEPAGQLRTSLTVIPTGKIKIGSKKALVLSVFGTPESVARDTTFGTDYLQLFYKGPMCVYEYLSCYIVIEKGVVTSIDSVKPSYQEF